MWVATQDQPRGAAHPFYVRLNQILDQRDFDRFVEGLCERFYADEGRPGLPPGRYFRLLLIGYSHRPVRFECSTPSVLTKVPKPPNRPWVGGPHEVTPRSIGS